MKRFFGNALSFLTRGSVIADLLLLGGIAGMVFGFMSFSQSATAPTREKIFIDLSPWALPKYTFYSLMRGILAYIFSLAFTLVYGYWAAKDKIAQRILVPLLDILQSIPVLGFLPILLLAFVNLVPGTNIGLEFAAVIMIFTAQAWNMTFSFFHSLSSIPIELRETGATFRFNWWERFRWLELPYATMGLVWNSMMSMAGGWFFLMVNEAFKIGDKDYRLPGIGAYMSEANDKGDWGAKLWAILAMVLMIVLLDQFLWRPVVVWAQKFRVEEGGETDNASSWFLDFLRHSHILSSIGKLLRIRDAKVVSPSFDATPKIDVNELPDVNRPNVAGKIVSTIVFVALTGGLLWGGFQLVLLIKAVDWTEWKNILTAALYTLGRVLISTVIGTLWALPAGIAIGLSPRLSRILQPVVQVVASFPAPMLFTIVLTALAFLPLGWSSIVLMLMGTQWYILFNVIAGAMAIPADLKEMSRSFAVTGWQRFWVLYVPACFPYLVTGWVTAAGGAWNASIVSEYIDANNYAAHGLGAEISLATAAGNNAKLAASVVVMSLLVVLFNRLVWKRMYNLAETRFSLSK